MTEITWTNCADEMPPNDCDYKIITVDSCGTCIDDGKSLNSIEAWCKENGTVWTPYTDEKWKELNR